MADPDADNLSSSTSTPRRERTVPLLDTVEKVKGYGTLTIFQMSASPYWYARFYEDKKVYKRSLKTRDRREAIQLAKKFFAELKYKTINKLPLTKKSGFEVCARQLLLENEARVRRGELAATKTKYDAARLEKHLLPYFGKMEVADIDYACISGFFTQIGSSDLNLTSNTLKTYRSHIKTILVHAQKMGVIQSLPAMPTFKLDDNPRPWFNSDEYLKLHTTARTNVRNTFSVASGARGAKRTIKIDDEIYDVILFMTNTYIRPSDLKVLKHKHVSIINKPNSYLKLDYPPTKGHSQPVVSQASAIKVYQRLRARQQAEGYGKDDDFVFQPAHASNRAYALQQIARQFDQVLKLADLKTTATGQSRTLYSLRHTAIMFRLLNAQGLDLLTLARGARTSPEMIERFYGKYLTAEMNVDLMQSQRGGPHATRQRKAKSKKITKQP